MTWVSPIRFVGVPRSSDLLAGVAEAGGEAVDGEQDGAFEARVHFGGGAAALQEDDLQQVERLQVGGAYIQGALQHR